MILAGLLPALLIGMFSYLQAARQDRGRTDGPGTVVLEYGNVWKLLPVIFVSLWALLFLYLAVVEPPEASDLPVVFGLVGLVTALIVPLALEVLGVAHRISPGGIERVSPWSKALVIPWRDVRSVTYEPAMAWFVVESRHGRVRVSRFLNGLADFRRTLETNVPRDRWAAAFGAAPAVGSTRARPEQGEHERRRIEDRKSHAAGLVCLVCGAGLAAMAWFEALHEGHYNVEAASIGPPVIVFGIGLLVHGGGLPRLRLTPLTRVYGVAGGVVGLLNLYFLGYFEPPSQASVFILLPLLVWLLPGGVLGVLMWPTLWLNRVFEGRGRDGGTR